MANVGIIDADLIWGKETRLPNLAAMKLSTWRQSKGDRVALISSPRHVTEFDRVYLCCAFTATAERIPSNIVNMPHVISGGSGLFFDLAEPLPKRAEHSFPDYNLYTHWLTSQPEVANRLYYTSASIGFLTRGCFRRCKFCINRNLSKAVPASPLSEFFSPDRKRVCLLDDNFLAYRGHKELLENLIKTCKRHKTQFEFNQGLDIRILQRETANLLNTSTRFGELIFAFDSIKDSKQVRKGLSILREAIPGGGAKGYVLCGFESQDWRDIATAFRRLEILWSYRCLGYIMRHENYKKADPCSRRLYIALATWVNQPQFQRVRSFREFCGLAGGKSLRSMRDFEKTYPDVAKRYFDLKYYNTPQAF